MLAQPVYNRIGQDDLLRAIERRLWIFPVGPDKTPLLKWTQGCTNNLETAEKLWREYPSGQLAAACSHSGIVAIDCDVKHGQDGIGEFHKLASELKISPEGCWATQTPSGGRHYLWRCHKALPRSSVGKLGTRLTPGIDVRARGAYIILPPSRMPSGDYKMLNAWNSPLAFVPEALYELLMVPDPAIIPANENTAQYNGDGSHWLEKYSAIATPGNRDDTCFRLCTQLRDDGMPKSQAEGVVIEFQQQVTTPGNPFYKWQALATLNSAYSRPRRDPARKAGL